MWTATGRATELVSDSDASSAGQSASASPASRDVGTGTDDPTAPVPLVDDQGRPVLNKDGKQIMRPAGLDPHMFVAAGLRDRERILAMAAAGASTGALAAEILSVVVHLWKFQRWHSWDAQRVGREYNSEFVDYATIAIGLYAASAGIPRNIILRIEDYITRSSQYKENPKMDQTYTHLPTTNVWNTDLGHELYQSGRIGVAGTPSVVP